MNGVSVAGGWCRGMLAVVLWMAAARAWALPATEGRPEAIDFNRDIRPILSNHCLKCHGPDAAVRQAGLRLDLREAAVGPAESGSRAIVPGQPQHSELIRRIEAEDPSERMPPEAENKPLSAEAKRLLRQWIAEGAVYQQHWAFVPPQRPDLPAVRDRSWPRNEIDYFILARLEAAGLAPAPPADRVTLIRRLTLDLTGLPPTPQEVDAFLADESPEAYARLVDRLLNSPHFGERLAVDWLDAARFADTHGYHIDSGRDMTIWRRWVIDAFNRNMPLDRFTVEQLAGDLLPEATLEQKIASGFNRNHMINFEGGAIPAEYLNAYIVDRVNTTATVWLGLTIGCAQCHDHKYDPISQREYYQLYAFFNSLPERGLDGAQGNAAPLVKVPLPERQQQLDRLAKEIAELEGRLTGPWPEADTAQAAWEAEALEAAPVSWQALEVIEATSAGGAKFEPQQDGSLFVSGNNPPRDTYSLRVKLPAAGLTALRVEALPDKRLVSGGPGRSANGNIVLTNVVLQLIDGQGKPTPQPLARASASFSQDKYPVAQAIDDNPASGWAIHPKMGEAHAAVFQLRQPLPAGPGDGAVVVALEFQSQFAQHQLGRFRLSGTAAADPHDRQTLPAEVVQALAVPAAQRNDTQRDLLRRHYREHVSPLARQVREQLAARQKQRAEIESRMPTTMVMEELPQPRETFVLLRGAYDKPGEKVQRDVPAFLPPLADDAPRNRLGLARWLVDPANPLTARVLVNRYWQMLMGTGLVATSEDFGSQGELPSHPELLDWLAVTFQQPEAYGSEAGGHAWNAKALLRRIVMSAAYRQASVASPEKLAADPDNRLLSRGPRFRLQAEFIRDQALAASGLLAHRIGGPSVSPYQPPGLWEELASRADGDKWTAQKYVQSHGADLYRRTMYTFWKRTSPPPTLVTFDAPDRETCTVRRARTNTPLQALVLMNDPTYVEAARKLAERVLLEAGTEFDQRLTRAYRLVLARRPRAEELQILGELYRQQQARFAADPAAAAALLAVGESPRNLALDAAEVAAWATVCSVILNLDEALTKG